MAAPLSRTNEIVILSGEGSRVTGEVNRLLAELPVSVNALTGVDLTKVTLSPLTIAAFLASDCSKIRVFVPLQNVEYEAVLQYNLLPDPCTDFPTESHSNIVRFEDSLGNSSRSLSTNMTKD